MSTDGNRTILLLLSLAMLQIASVAVADEAATTQSDAEVLRLTDAIVSRYESFGAFSMDFVQTSYWSLADSAFVTKGSLHVKRPNHIAVSYADGGRIVILGDSLRAYTPATKQFYVAGIDTASSVIDPARLLRAYRPEASDPLRAAGDDPRFGPETARGLLDLSLRPHDRLSEPSRLVVRVDPRTNRVHSILAISSGSDWTRYDIVAERVVPAHADGTFELLRPEGAETVTAMPFGGF